MPFQSFDDAATQIEERLGPVLAPENVYPHPWDAYRECWTLLEELVKRQDIHLELTPPEQRTFGLAQYSARLCLIYINVARGFLGLGMRPQAFSFLTQAWERLAERQKQLGKRVYRAAIAFYLAQLHYNFGRDVAAAMWWVLLTEADDVLCGGGSDDAGGVQFMKSTLGVSDTVPQVLREIAGKNHTAQKRLQGKETDYAEDIVVHFVQEAYEHSHILARSSDSSEYPLSKTYYAALLKRVKTSRTTNHWC